VQAFVPVFALPRIAPQPEYQQGKMNLRSAALLMLKAQNLQIDLHHWLI
jgi:hypothetical protein